VSNISDYELLDQFVRHSSEAAFSTLVERHLALVHSVALRQTDDLHAAQDISQAVFIILARKAATLRAGTVLPGWLYYTARLTAANFRRAEWRRSRREQEAAMQLDQNEAAPDVVWRELSPHLESAMARLKPRDRDALVLRYFQNRSMAEVGAALGWTQNTAQQRVGRALEKLRKLFIKRGCVIGVTALAGIISANAVQAAPTGLAGTVASNALASGAVAASSTFTIAKGVSNIMTWTKIKTAAVVTVGLLGIGGISTATWVTFFKPRVVFSSFGSAGEYDKAVAWFVGIGKPNNGDSGYRGQAEWFSPDVNGRLKTIEVGLHSGRQRGGALNFSIADDENGIPGKVLEHFKVPRSASVKGSTLVLKSVAKPKLRASQKYWLCAEPADPLSQWTWSYNNQKLARGFAYEREQGKWTYFKDGPRNGVFSVTVSP